MNKYYGIIGFSIIKDNGYGNYGSSITERPYYGDVLQNSRRFEQRSDTTNDDVLVNNKLSILTDTFMDSHIGNLIFVELGGACWKITNVEIQYPRLILTLGGVYRGDRA